MDIKKYIASGILENYVLGSVTPQEQQEVERYAQLYPEIELELLAIEDALSQYSKSVSRTMPAGLASKITAHIDTLAEGSPPSAPAKKSSSSEKNVQQTQESLGNWFRNILALLCLLLLAGAGFFYSESNKLKEGLSDMNRKLVDQQLICDEVKQQQQQYEEQINILRDHAYRSVIMKGTKKAPDAVAAIYYNEDSKKTYLDIRNLPTPASGKQYQLWAIVGGLPVDMGVFNIPIDSIDFVEVPHIGNAQAFAVTLEPEGGKAAPTMAEMYVVGNTT